VQSRRDQVQAQSYVLGRLTSALISAKPEALENPNRRLVVGTVVGVLVAALVVAGFAVFGFLRPGGAKSWRAPGTLVVEKDTGTRYIFVGDRLRPVLNYSSALLLLGKRPKVVSVSRASLRGVAHGQPLGIVGAPDALPPASALDGAVWSVCALTGRDDAGATLTATTVVLARPPDPLVSGGPLRMDQGVVVTVEHGGGTYLGWQGRRFRLAQPWLTAVFGVDDGGYPVRAGWLDTLPAGPDIAPVAVPGRGGAGPTIDGRPATVGQLMVARVAGTPDRHYVLQRDGLSRLTDLGYAIALSDPETAKAYPGGRVVPIELSAAAVARLPKSTHAAMPDEVPGSVPAIARPVIAWCFQLGGDGDTLVDGFPVGRRSAVQPGPAAAVTARTAAAVEVEPGVGGLVRVGRPDQAAGASYYLVTDVGIKYPIAGLPVVRLLGYRPEDAAAVPSTVLDLLPTGPLLDPQQAGG
jgi:type VII secretion protein EccB